ncbi:SAM-dependent MidA family methyltransferase [Plasticicumulans lactativorans]|uniref:SAM-dependent MidA family methyltransferase n=2 Tax=Plasticicumulans lactativorans TaxID=1133106 RepID=A0A4V2SD73_9GAMM|nr:SAM-dependent MidA family methyltransferase [Plasticicumulans lactativorans]
MVGDARLAAQPDRKPMRPPSVSIDRLPPPTAEAAAHSARLVECIRAEIAAAGGAIPFERYMALALYAPGLGYYSAGAQKFGAAGDFVTAPELSPLFSRCLARQCRELLDALGGGDILEVGAGSGVMAADILAELDAAGCLPGRYRVLEASAELRARQHATLAARVPHLLARVDWLERLPDGGFEGVVLGNEVLDAMPVRRFRVSAAGLHEVGVAVGEGGDLELVELPADATLAAAVAAIETALGRPLPPGYDSELNPYLDGWFRGLAAAVARGAVILLDYGYPRREYYHPERTRGTLICHYRHRAHEEVLLWPGLQDLTANVDFTAVADAGVGAGFALAGYTTQAYFLFGCGLEALVAETDPADTVRYLALAQQVKRLTLPGEMGERFKAIGFLRGLALRPCGFALFDQGRRL